MTEEPAKIAIPPEVEAAMDAARKAFRDTGSLILANRVFTDALEMAGGTMRSWRRFFMRHLPQA